MRKARAFAQLLILLAVACDEKRDPLPEPAVETTTAKTESTADARVERAATDRGAADAGEAGATLGVGDAGPATTSPPLPERPIPKPQTTVRATMPIEVQQKAIMYTAAMRAPRAGEASADPAYAEALALKLRPIVLAVDTGANKASMNRVEVIAGGRQLDLLMSGGCTDKTPLRIATKAGTSLGTLAEHGILVLRCNDAKLQCFQSTRDSQDALCMTGYRRR